MELEGVLEVDGSNTGSALPFWSTTDPSETLIKKIAVRNSIGYIQESLLSITILKWLQELILKVEWLLKSIKCKNDTIGLFIFYKTILIVL